MSVAVFHLDSRLAADTHFVAQLALCDVLLMNDARYTWLILVPRRDGLVEITDLTATEQTTLWREVNRVSTALRAIAPCDKLNIGALGNIVRQLHIHVVARCEGDAAWPGAVWGCGIAQAYSDDQATQLVNRLRSRVS